MSAPDVAVVPAEWYEQELQEAREGLHPVMAEKVGQHEAQWSPQLLTRITELITGYVAPTVDHRPVGLDPMGGKGRAFWLDGLDMEVHCGEIERLYAGADRRIVVADARKLTYRDLGLDGPVNVVFTSVTFGNRDNESYDADMDKREANARAADRKVSTPGWNYGFGVGGEVVEGSTGADEFHDPAYRQLHVEIWQQQTSDEVLEPGGFVILNAKDHLSTMAKGAPDDPYRYWTDEHGGRCRYRVTDWHIDVLVGLGLRVVGRWKIATKGHRGRANVHRVPYEEMVLLQKPARNIVIV